MSRLMLCRLVGGKCIANVSGQARAAGNQTASLVQYYRSNNSLDHQSRIIASQSIGHHQQNLLSVRSMYTETSLRLDSLDALRQDKGRIFDSGKGRYIERVKKYIESDENQSIVKEDLINIIGLAENEQHLDLIEQMILSHNMRNHLADGPWGSMVMRLYYRMNDLQRACKNIKDTERFGEFFMQYAAFRVVMTMLYKNGQYEELLEIYNLANEKMLLNNHTRRRQLDLLALAACAKMNTPESFSIAESIYNTSVALECRHLSTRLESLFVYMAINMNESTKALNLLTGTKLRGTYYLPTLTLKTLALMKLDRYEDIVFNLREAQQGGTAPASGRPVKVLPQEVADMLREKQIEIGDENVRQELMDLLVELKDNDMLEVRSLEDIIFNEIETREGGPPPGSSMGSGGRPGGRASNYQGSRGDGSGGGTRFRSSNYSRATDERFNK